MPRADAASGIRGRRAKALTKVRRYSASGTTQSSGADAMSVLMCAVTPSKSADGTAL